VTLQQALPLSILCVRILFQTQATRPYDRNISRFCYLSWSKKVKFSRYRPKSALGVPVGEGFRIFSTFGTMKVVRLSPLRTGRLYLREFSWYSILQAESTPGHMVPSVASEKIPSNTTGNGSRDLPTSSALLLTTTLPEAPLSWSS
jgi:hypothetical protein